MAVHTVLISRSEELGWADVRAIVASMERVRLIGEVTNTVQARDVATRERPGIIVSGTTIDARPASFEGEDTVRSEPEFQLPPGRLLPMAGARVTEARPSALPSMVASASAQACGVVCAVVWTTGCGSFCAFFGPIGGFICGIAYCAPAGTLVCKEICA